MSYEREPQFKLEEYRWLRISWLITKEKRIWGRRHFGESCWCAGSPTLLYRGRMGGAFPLISTQKGGTLRRSLRLYWDHCELPAVWEVHSDWRYKGQNRATDGWASDRYPGTGLHPQGCCGRMPVCFPFARCGLHTVYSAYSKNAGLDLVLEDSLNGQTGLNKENLRTQLSS